METNSATRLQELQQEEGKLNFEMTVLQALPESLLIGPENVDDVLIMAGMVYHMQMSIAKYMSDNRVQTAEVINEMNDYKDDLYLLEVGKYMQHVFSSVEYCSCGQNCDGKDAEGGECPQGAGDPSSNFKERDVESLSSKATEPLSLSDSLLKGMASAEHGIKVFKGDFLDFIKFIQEEVGKEQNKNTQQS